MNPDRYAPTESSLGHGVRSLIALGKGSVKSRAMPPDEANALIKEMVRLGEVEDSVKQLHSSDPHERAIARERLGGQYRGKST